MFLLRVYKSAGTKIAIVQANVFAFDAYDRAMLAQVSDVFVRYEHVRQWLAMVYDRTDD